MKKLFLALPVLALIMGGCKKQNEDHIVGDWSIQNYYENGVESTKSYGFETDQIHDCGGSVYLTYNPYSFLKKSDWKFKEDGTFSNFELSENHNFEADYSCTLGYAYYEETNSSSEYGGTYSISEEGKGSELSIIVDGASVDGKIFKLNENEFEFTLSFDGDTYKYVLRRD